VVAMPNGDENITGWNMHPSNAHDARVGVAEFFPKDTPPNGLTAFSSSPQDHFPGASAPHQLNSVSTQPHSTQRSVTLAAAPPHIRLSPTHLTSD
jgi:hypothetical protein